MVIGYEDQTNTGCWIFSTICVRIWRVSNMGFFLLCRMLPKYVSSTLTVNLMCCTSLLWLSLLPEAVLQHLFTLHTIISIYHQSSCMQYAFRSPLVMLPVSDIMYCLWESFGSGHHSCDVIGIYFCFSKFNVIFVVVLGSCVLLYLWEVLYN
jgi:hypothetical protein